MQLSLRLFILACAVLIIATVLTNIRKRKILMADATGWVAASALMLLVAVFPGIVTWVSRLLGVQSPANLVFFVVTGLLVVKAFRDTAQISLLRHKVEELAQELALMRQGGPGNPEDPPRR